MLRTGLKVWGGWVVVVALTPNTSLAAPGALANRLQRLQRRTAAPPSLSKMADGVTNKSNLRLLDPPINFAK